MTQTTYASGTQTATIGTEHFLSSPNAAGNYALCLNLANMANGDILEVRAYKVAASGDSVQPLWFYGFYDAQPSINTVVLSDIVPNSLTDTNAVRFSIKQTHGTGRAYVWSVMQEKIGRAHV